MNGTKCVPPGATSHFFFFFTSFIFFCLSPPYITMSEPVETQESTKTTQPKAIQERVPGTTMLPLARIKRVIKEDKDVSLINAEATFCIAYATVSTDELFEKSFN